MKQINSIYILILSIIYISKINCVLKKNNDFRYKFPVCNKLNCPRSRGICTRDNKCICLKNYITHENFTEYGEYQCNYLQSNQANIFILEFLFGFGTGHFFLGNYILGFVKLIFTLITAFLVAVSPCLEENKMLSPNLTRTKNYMIIGYIIWQLFDGAMILFDFYKDSNGVPMNSSWS